MPNNERLNFEPRLMNGYWADSPDAGVFLNDEVGFMVKPRNNTHLFRALCTLLETDPQYCMSQEGVPQVYRGVPVGVRNPLEDTDRDKEWKKRNEELHKVNNSPRAQRYAAGLIEEKIQNWFDEKSWRDLVPAERMTVPEAVEAVFIETIRGVALRKLEKVLNLDIGSLDGDPKQWDTQLDGYSCCPDLVERLRDVGVEEGRIPGEIIRALREWLDCVTPQQTRHKEHEGGLRNVAVVRNQSGRAQYDFGDAQVADDLIPEWLIWNIRLHQASCEAEENREGNDDRYRNFEKAAARVLEEDIFGNSRNNSWLSFSQSRKSTQGEPEDDQSEADGGEVTYKKPTQVQDADVVSIRIVGEEDEEIEEKLKGVDVSSTFEVEQANLVETSLANARKSLATRATYRGDLDYAESLWGAQFARLSFTQVIRFRNDAGEEEKRNVKWILLHRIYQKEMLAEFRGDTESGEAQGQQQYWDALLGEIDERGSKGGETKRKGDRYELQTRRFGWVTPDKTMSAEKEYFKIEYQQSGFSLLFNKIWDDALADDAPVETERVQAEQVNVAQPEKKLPEGESEPRELEVFSFDLDHLMHVGAIAYYLGNPGFTNTGNVVALRNARRQTAADYDLVVDQHGNEATNSQKEVSKKLRVILYILSSLAPLECMEDKDNMDRGVEKMNKHLNDSGAMYGLLEAASVVVQRKEIPHDGEVFQAFTMHRDDWDTLLSDQWKALTQQLTQGVDTKTQEDFETSHKVAHECIDLLRDSDREGILDGLDGSGVLHNVEDAVARALGREDPWCIAGISCQEHWFPQTINDVEMS